MFQTPSAPSYLAIVERALGGFNAFFPALPNCIATGRNIDHLQHNAERALFDYLKRLCVRGGGMANFVARDIPRDNNSQGVARMFIRPDAHLSARWLDGVQPR